MFLMIGISQGRKDLDHEQLVICTQCKRRNVSDDRHFTGTQGP